MPAEVKLSPAENKKVNEKMSDHGKIFDKKQALQMERFGV